MAAGATGRLAVPSPIAETASFARRTLGEFAALAQVALAAGIVLVCAERHSYLVSVHRGAWTGWFAGPLAGLLPGLTRSQSTLGRGFHDAEIAMLVAWLVIVLSGRAIRSGVVIGCVVAVNVLFFLCPPLALTDLFNYLAYSRMELVQHLNPYVQLPIALRHDPVFLYSNWHHLHSPYGPLFTILVMPIAWLPLPVAYWVYKVVALLASFGMLAALWQCARRLDRPPAAAVAFVGLNPIVMIYVLGARHYDALLMGCVLAGCLLLLLRQEVAGGAVLVAAVALKASAGLLAPVIALGAARRGRAVGGFAGGGVALAGLTLLFFGPHLPDVADQSRLVNILSVPNVAGYLAGHGGADATVRHIAVIAGLAGGAICAAVAWRTRRWVSPAGWAGLVSLATVSWLCAWYIIWALPFAALSRSRTLRAVTLAVVVVLVLIRTGDVYNLLARDLGLHLGNTATWRANHAFEHRLIRG